MQANEINELVYNNIKTDNNKYFHKHKGNQEQRVKGVQFANSKASVTKKTENHYAYLLESAIKKELIKITKAMKEHQHFSSGSYAEMTITEDFEKVSSKTYHYNHNLAPFHEQHNSKKLGFKVSSMMKRATQIMACNDFYFYALTYPNKPIETSAKELKRINARAKKVNANLFKALEKKYPNSLIGQLINTEMTYSKAKGYNPHNHNVLTINNKVDKAELKAFMFEYWYKNFLKKETWDKDYTYYEFKNVWEQPKAFNQVKDTSELVNEVSKYCAKSSDYLNHGLDVFVTFYHFFYRNRTIEFRGTLKQLAQDYDNGLIELIEEEQAEEEQSEKVVKYELNNKYFKVLGKYLNVGIKNVENDNTIIVDYKYSNEMIRYKEMPPVNYYELLEHGENIRRKVVVTIYHDLETNSIELTEQLKKSNE